MIKHPIVCICGSTRFRQQILDAMRHETMAGKIVLLPGVYAHAGDSITDREKEMLDGMHLEKIAMSDEVLVVNPGGYIGESTAAEICRAQLIGKPVRYTEEPRG